MAVSSETQPFMPDRPGAERWRRFAVECLHIVALSGFAVAQPLLDLLGRNATFFAAHQSSSGAVVAFAVVLLLGVPSILILVEAIALVLSPRFQRHVHDTVVGTLGGLVLAPPLIRELSVATSLSLLLFVMAGAFVALAYRRSDGVRHVLSWAAFAPVAFLLWFLFATPANDLVFGREGPAAGIEPRAFPPVVVVVLDELSLAGLLTTDGELNRERFPNFARLADLATWYPNAMAIHDQTRVAVTSMLTGRLVPHDAVPIASAYPRTLFTLLGDAYTLEVQESVTHLCPARLCEAAAGGDASPIGAMLSDAAVVYGHLTMPDAIAVRLLPEIDTRWAGFGEQPLVTARSSDLTLEEIRESTRATLQAREEDIKWERFLSELEQSETPTLHYLHSLLPHAAWRYLPDGHVYENDFFGDLFTDGGGATWRDAAVYSDHGMQRFLLQTAYVDRQIGRMIDRLEEAEILDEALMVVMADHGISFRAGGARRSLSLGAAREEILPVPMFIKYPRQESGKVDLVLTQPMDILPTIADVLGIDLDDDLDGSTLRDHASHREPMVVTSEGVVALDMEGLNAATEASARFHEVFGAGDERFDIYGIGPNRSLLGHEVASIRVSETEAGTTAAISQVGRLRKVDLTASAIPARITGVLTSEPAHTDLALALGGRIAAVGSAYHFPDEDQWRFSLFVPTDLLDEGCNEAALYYVAQGEALTEVPLVESVGC